MPAMMWCRDAESNCGHKAFQASALPTELSRQQARKISKVAPIVNNRHYDFIFKNRYIPMERNNRFVPQPASQGVRIIVCPSEITIENTTQ